MGDVGRPVSRTAMIPTSPKEAQRLPRATDRVEVCTCHCSSRHCDGESASPASTMPATLFLCCSKPPISTITRPVPTDDFGRGMLFQPADEGLGLAIGE